MKTCEWIDDQTCLVSLSPTNNESSQKKYIKWSLRFSLLNTLQQSGGEMKKIKALITQAKRGHKCFARTRALPFTRAPSVIASLQKDTEETHAKLGDDSFSPETAAYYIKLKIIPIYIPRWIIHQESSEDGTTDISWTSKLSDGVFSRKSPPFPHDLQPERVTDGSSVTHPRVPLE